MEFEGFLRSAPDGDPDQIRRKEIRGELDALPRAIDRSGQCLGETRLADARNVFDQDVTIGKQSNEGEFDGASLSSQRNLDIVGNRSEKTRECPRGAVRSRMSRRGHVGHARRKTRPFDCRVLNDPESRTVLTRSWAILGEIVLNKSPKQFPNRSDDY